jgi:hypothetical protein
MGDIYEFNGQEYDFPVGTPRDTALRYIKKQTMPDEGLSRKAWNAVSGFASDVLDKATGVNQVQEIPQQATTAQKMALVKEMLAKKQLAGTMEAGGMMPQLNQPLPPATGLNKVISTAR